MPAAKPMTKIERLAKKICWAEWGREPEAHGHTPDTFWNSLTPEDRARLFADAEHFIGLVHRVGAPTLVYILEET